jgi:hypothetical protein
MVRRGACGERLKRRGEKEKRGNGETGEPNLSDDGSRARHAIRFLQGKDIGSVWIIMPHNTHTGGKIPQLCNSEEVRRSIVIMVGTEK